MLYCLRASCTCNATQQHQTASWQCKLAATLQFDSGPVWYILAAYAGLQPPALRVLTEQLRHDQLKVSLKTTSRKSQDSWFRNCQLQVLSSKTQTRLLLCAIQHQSSMFVMIQKVCTLICKGWGLRGCGAAGAGPLEEGGWVRPNKASLSSSSFTPAFCALTHLSHAS